MRLFICCCMLLSLTACIDRPSRQAYLHIPQGEWRKTDTLTLAIVSRPDIHKGGKERAESQEVRIDVRHTNAYPYTNLIVRLDALWGDTVLNLPLADKRGHRKGHGLGHMYQLSCQAGMLRLEENVPDTLRFRLVSLMPDSVLKGIHDIGIRITKK